MPIEFQCQFCGQVLKTSDDKAGRKARCPGCSEIVTVPEAAPPERQPVAPPRVRRRRRSGSDADDEFDEFGDSDDAIDEYELDADSDDELMDSEPRRRRSGRSANTSCPMCGEAVDRRDERCPACGESLRGGDWRRGEAGEPMPLEVADVFSSAWAIFSANKGVCGGALAVAMLAYGLGALVWAFVFPGLMILMQNGEGVVFAFFGMLVSGLVFFTFVTALQLGFQRVYVDVVTGEGAGLNGLFSCWHLVPRLLLISLTLCLMAIPVSLLVFLGGLIAGQSSVLGVLYLVVLYILVYAAGISIWPMAFVLVDQEPPGIGALRIAFEMTRGNRLKSFGLFLLIALMLGALWVAGVFLFALVSTLLAQLSGALAVLVGFVLGVCMLAGGFLLVGLGMTTVAVMYCRLAGRQTIE